MNGKTFLIKWRDALAASDLPPSARLVGFVLSIHMDAEGGSCFPSTRLLADETGLARNTVMGAVDELEDNGLLEVERGGGHRASRYQAVLPNGSASEPNDAAARNGFGSPTEPSLVQPVSRSGSPTEPEDAHEDAQVGRSTNGSPKGDPLAATASRRGAQRDFFR